MQVGGDPEQYMEAPTLPVSKGFGGPGSFIASLLDAIGVHRQVAKGPKTEGGDKKESSKTPPPPAPEAAPARVQEPPRAPLPPSLPILDSVASLGTKFEPISARMPQMLGGYRALTTPLTEIDPDREFRRK